MSRNANVFVGGPPLRRHTRSAVGFDDTTTAGDPGVAARDEQLGAQAAALLDPIAQTYPLPSLPVGP